MQARDLLSQRLTSLNWAFLAEREVKITWRCERYTTSGILMDDHLKMLFPEA